MHLSDIAWPDIEGDNPGSSPILVVPLGSTEQHGPHLPLDTDSRIVTAVAEALMSRRDDLAVSACIPIGASGEHDGFPGTLSMGSAILEEMVVEIGRSADRFAGVVWLNAHGGNAVALARADRRLRDEGRRSLVVHCSVDPDEPDSDAHAGYTETSLMLAIDPEAVAMDRAAPGATEPWIEIRDRVLAHGVASVAPNGVLGDPTGASAHDGVRLLVGMVDRVAATVARWADDHRA